MESRRHLVRVLVVLMVGVLALFPAGSASTDDNGPGVMAIIDAQVAQWLDEVTKRGARSSPRAYGVQPKAGGTAALSSNGTCLPGDCLQTSCYPSCPEDDGHFLSIVAEDLESLVDLEVGLKLVVSRAAETFELGVFDGNSIGTWDYPSYGTPGDPLEFTLYADPDGDGTGTLQIGQWMGNTMPDNAWWTTTLTNVAAAQEPDGDYVYRLVVRMLPTSGRDDTWSNFKVRVSNGWIMVAAGSAWAFTGPLYSGLEGYILYPYASIGDFDTTTYDGIWQFYIHVSGNSPFVALWDGDFDRGTCLAWKWKGQNPDGTWYGVCRKETDLDTNDPDTADEVPTWNESPYAHPEGVAWVEYCDTEQTSTGCPADDRTMWPFVRHPAVEYRLQTADNRVFENPNPSGNREWEQFRIDSDPNCTSGVTADYCESESFPAGMYQVRLKGIDLSNLNAWYSEYDTFGSPGTGTPGYWGRHPEAWPVDEIEIGGVTYSKADAITYVNEPIEGDKRYSMFAQLVAAKLNVYIGNAKWCIEDVIAAADDWMVTYGPLPGGTPVRASDPAWQDEGQPLFLELDNYDQGYLCAPYHYLETE